MDVDDPKAREHATMPTDKKPSAWVPVALRLRRRITRTIRKLGLSWRRAAFLLLFLLLLPFLPRLFTMLETVVKVPGVVISLVAPGVPELEQTNGRTNILLLGVAGGTHEGAGLTDTIIVASVDANTRDVVVLSLPRDLWIADLAGGARLNAAYTIGESKRSGGGLILARSMVAAVVGLPIHYAVRLDFAGFERAVDQLGGIDLVVDQAFDDTRYPITGREMDECGGDPDYLCRYESIRFDAGPQHMDGSTALKFVRSRMGTNDEGTDFARTRRQQKVLSALREKVLSTSLLLQPARIKGLYDTFGKSVDTDIAVEVVGKFYRLVRHLDQGNIRAYVLDDSGEEPLLVNPSKELYDGQWVLVPNDPSFKKIHAWVDMLLADPSYIQPAPTATASAR